VCVGGRGEWVGGWVSVYARARARARVCVCVCVCVDTGDRIQAEFIDINSNLMAN